MLRESCQKLRASARQPSSRDTATGKGSWRLLRARFTGRIVSSSPLRPHLPQFDRLQLEPDRLEAVEPAPPIGEVRLDDAPEIRDLGHAPVGEVLPDAAECLAPEIPRPAGHHLDIEF